jgi:NAD(P)-dependent dehydrogenase (short-subunit alcohol dehydrogenase family)
MRRILVTGANKGIGKAIVEAILAEHDDTFVLLGSRDLERGRTAASTLLHHARIEVVALDVADARSVADAAKRVGSDLYGLVNNAGVATGVSLEEMLATNTFGVHRVCEAFLPLLDANRGRIVNVTSASGPNYVSSVGPETKRFFLDETMTWPRLKAFIDAHLAKGDVNEPYGFSKACTNAYTMILAREHPALRINACTPGFIQTDLTRHFWADKSQSAEELGMKPPAAGARAPMHLLFGELEGNGRYYGSDAKRSPLDRYRAPGTAPYTGD